MQMISSYAKGKKIIIKILNKRVNSWTVIQFTSAKDSRLVKPERWKVEISEKSIVSV